MLRALCQSGQLGPSEMLLLTGYRNQSNDLVVNKYVLSSIMHLPRILTVHTV